MGECKNTNKQIFKESCTYVEGLENDDSTVISVKNKLILLWIAQFQFNINKWLTNSQKMFLLRIIFKSESE